MIQGIGIDLVELERMAAVLERTPRFVERILTESERQYAATLSGQRYVEHVAGRFAAKEAFAKAFGTGIGKELSFHDIEIKRHDNGRPQIVRPLAEGVHVAITHTKQYAMAQVIIER